MDNFNRIARTNVYIIFGKLLDKLIKTNDDGDVILCKAGLSELVEEYSFKLLHTHTMDHTETQTLFIIPKLYVYALGNS